MIRFVRSFLSDEILRAFAMGFAFQSLMVCILSLPFWLIWNTLAPVYGHGFLPPAWQQLPYWHVVGLFALPKISAWIFGVKVEFGR